MQVFCNHLLDYNDAQIKKIEADIKANPKIKSYTVESKDEAFKKMIAKLFENDKKSTVGLKASMMEISFKIKLKDSMDTAAIEKQFQSIPDVQKVSLNQQTIDVIAGGAYWIPIISIAIFLVLLVISMFIIANTIKLTVFARKREINIMKYIGATDWFIRMPFLVEGILIGVIGAAIASVLTAVGYSAIAGSFSGWLEQMGITIIKVIDFRDIAISVLLHCCWVSSWCSW